MEQPTPSFDIVREPTPDPVYEKKRRTMLIVTIGIVILVGVGLWYIWYRNQQKQLTNPLRQLQDLEKSSEPITETPAQRALQLDALEKNSDPVQASPDERTNDLNALNQ